MMDFTRDELNLMMLYSPGTKPGLCEALIQMKEQLSEEEAELCALADSVLNKISKMDDETFDELNLYPDFKDWREKMNAKERFYSGLAKETIGKITSNKDNWTSFLVTVSRNYEFTYPEQVMIYAQRPNATFCKPYDEWNDENYRRYVRRGSTGIALFVTNREKPYLRYVFDVADTGVRRSSPELKPWEVTEENRAYVMGAMEGLFAS